MKTIRTWEIEIGRTYLVWFDIIKMIISKTCSPNFYRKTKSTQI